MVKQPKIAFIKIDDRRYNVIKYESLPAGDTGYGNSDEFLPIK